ncbi:MAG: hydrolase [Thiogranum sp.]|nr:hydrolase [Thiogranum sp.]
MTERTDLCRCSDSLLLVVDMQERLADAVPAEDFNPAATNTVMLLQAAAGLEIPVVRTEQYPKGLGKTVAALQPHLSEAAVKLDKTGFSCCSAGGFMEALQSMQRRQVIIAGMETHICVLQTAFELQQRGYQVFVAADACCARSRERSSNGIQRLRQAGIAVTHSESVLFEWLRDATHPHFKTLSKLLK